MKHIPKIIYLALLILGSILISSSDGSNITIGIIILGIATFKFSKNSVYFLNVKSK